LKKYSKINLNIPEFGLISLAVDDHDSAIHYIRFGELSFGNFQHTTLLKEAEEQILQYFKGGLKEFKLPLYYNGTKFQNGVWNTLTKIPYGEVISYKQLAEKCGYKKAFRAVGMANNKNPLPIVIPCHRGVNHNGELGGFAPGLNFKKKLLKIEGIEVVKNRLKRAVINVER